MAIEAAALVGWDFGTSPSYGGSREALANGKNADLVWDDFRPTLSLLRSSPRKRGPSFCCWIPASAGMSGPKRIMLYYGAHGHNQGFQRMRSLIVAAAVACGIVSVCLTGPSGAQAPQKFNPRVCNASGSDAIFAVIVRTAPNMWRVRGWYDVT